MRCPYCGVSNAEQARFCVHCGRDMTTGKPGPGVRQQPPYAPQSPPVQRPPTSTVTPKTPYQPSLPVQPVQGRGSGVPTMPPQSQQASQSLRMRPQPAPSSVAEPDPPVPFPPKTIEQFQALEQGALAYNVLDTTTNAQWKKTVRIVFPRCIGWQQAATLLKALKEQLNTSHETIVIQGLRTQDIDVYGFTNGQLTFDRHARLGGETMTRYLLETNDGFASDSVRVVLTE